MSSLNSTYQENTNKGSTISDLNRAEDLNECNVISKHPGAGVKHLTFDIDPETPQKLAQTPPPFWLPPTETRRAVRQECNLPLRHDVTDNARALLQSARGADKMATSELHVNIKTINDTDSYKCWLPHTQSSS